MSNTYIVRLLDLMNDRKQDGLFVLSSPSELGKICHLFGASGKLKQVLGLRWEIHISQMPQAGRDRDKLLGKKTSGIIETVRAIIDKLREPQSTLIVLPANKI